MYEVPSVFEMGIGGTHPLAEMALPEEVMTSAVKNKHKRKFFDNFDDLKDIDEPPEVVKLIRREMFYYSQFTRDYDGAVPITLIKPNGCNQVNNH